MYQKSLNGNTGNLANKSFLDSKTMQPGVTMEILVIGPKKILMEILAASSKGLPLNYTQQTYLDRSLFYGFMSCFLKSTNIRFFH